VVSPKTKEKLRPAYIDLSVTCMGCGAVFFYGVYAPGVIGWLQKEIRKAGWVHAGESGTLCPKCLKERSKEKENE